MIPNLCTDLTSSISEFDRSQVVTVTCATRTTARFSFFTSIKIGAAHYRDIGAACGCADLSLVRVGFQAYTICKAHQLTEIGPLIRATGQNGRPA